MKKPFLSLFILTFATTLSAQIWPFAYDSLEVGNVKAFVRSDGALFENNLFGGLMTQDANIGLITGSGLWIGGIAQSGQLHLSVHDWGSWQGTGYDFWPGPLSQNTAATDSITTAQHDRFWKIDRVELDAYLQDFQDNGIVDNPSAYPNVYDWPAFLTDFNGNTLADAAPWVDVNGNLNDYNPDQGDYPRIKGDAMIWWVFNDRGPDPANDRYNPSPMGLEVHAMLYGFDCPGNELEESIFLEYHLVNRSNETYADVFAGQWTDFDLGGFLDDYVGVDSIRGMYYGYNGTNNDNQFGANTPAVGIQMLRGGTAPLNDGIDNDSDGVVDEPGEDLGLTNFLTYRNDFTITPTTSQHYYGNLQSFIPSTSNPPGVHAVDNYSNGGPGNGNPDSASGPPTNFIFSGDVCNQVGWTMANAGIQPIDRRAIGSSGPFMLAPNASDTIVMAIIINKEGNYLQNACNLGADADYIQALYDAGVDSCVIAGEVYPGDANHDRVADAWDILPIGLHYQTSGPARPNASLNWVGQAAPDWNDSLASGVNIKHVDTDGSGTIDRDDTLAIELNYGLTHFSQRDAESVDGAPFYFTLSDTVIDPGDTIEVSVWLGTMDTLAQDVYGIAFSLEYDTSQVESMVVDMNPSWLGINGVDLLSFSKNLADVGRLDIAQVRLDQANVSGFGRLANIIVVMDDDIAKTLIPFAMDVSRLDMINKDENELDVSVEPLDASISTAISDLLEVEGLSVFPNPTQGELMIRWDRGPATQIRLWDMQGQLILTERSPQGESQKRLSLNALPKGLYHLELIQETRRSIKTVIRH
ncbi:MAG: T9SS type A sorting domain-containing protein [Bacteroidota bacterium]